MKVIDCIVVGVVGVMASFNIVAIKEIREKVEAHMAQHHAESGVEQKVQVPDREDHSWCVEHGENRVILTTDTNILRKIEKSIQRHNDEHTMLLSSSSCRNSDVCLEMPTNNICGDLQDHVVTTNVLAPIRIWNADKTACVTNWVDLQDVGSELRMMKIFGL